jgi:hypothetical protein
VLVVHFEPDLVLDKFENALQKVVALDRDAIREPHFEIDAFLLRRLGSDIERKVGVLAGNEA